MTSKKTPSFRTELRHLSSAPRHQLVGLLDVNDNWKLLAAVLPNPDHPHELLLKTTQILLLEEQRKRPNGSPSNALLEYWGTYGHKRHTFADAIYYLEQCGLNRAADLIKCCIQQDAIDHNSHNDELPTKRDLHNWSDLPEYSPCADRSIKPSAPNQSLLSFSDDYDHMNDTVSSQKSNVLVRFPYKSLRISTDNFLSKSIEQGGTKLGEGSFGEVFRCATALLNSDIVSDCKFVAVKRFKQLPGSESNEEEKKGQFVSELNIMRRFQHPNLVKLFGYSNDGPYFCIVTEYLENGSLHNYLEKCARNSVHCGMSFRYRFKIAFDVANAIVYLHTYTTLDECGNPIEKPFIHRDIKSANIFLDDRLCARLGDLGLVRQGSTSNTVTTVVTKTVIGTSVYMAPEAFRGDVSVKIDTFSYGVVLLELLSGQSAFDEAREESDIVSYVDEMLGDDFDTMATLDQKKTDLVTYLKNSVNTIDNSKLQTILDSRCTNWNLLIAEQLILLAKCCIEQRKKNRPTMVEVFKVLKHLQQQIEM